MDALARGYVTHGQMASALIACNGGDDFVRERGGLHCNVRNCCATVCNENGEPTGIEILSCFADEADNGEEGNDNGRTQQQTTLRNPKPDVNQQTLKENLAKMTPDEIKLLFDELPQAHPWFADVLNAFVALENAQLSDNEEENSDRVN